VWQSVTGLGKVQRRYVDAVSGQAAYYGIVAEGGNLAVVTARLKIDNHQIVEAEWYIERDGDPGLPGAQPPNVWSPDGLTASPPPERKLAKQKQLPRDAMIGIEDGKIRNIWTAMYYPGPERAVPNWPPFDGNFPLDAATAAQPTSATPAPPKPSQ